MARKHTFEYINSCFDNESYELLSNNYINGSQKLNYICPNGHKYYITYYNWAAGHRCPRCVVEKRRIDIEYIRQKLLSENYTLLTKEYVNNKQRLKCICDKGHKCTITWAGWNGRGDRCKKCSYHKMSIRQTGPGNSQWRGGIGRFPYCYEWQNKEYKEYIKERDDYLCQNIMCASVDNLVVHHIDYVKINCNRENLITLCRGCNTMVNVNREWYTTIFRRLLNKKFDYKYEDIRFVRSNVYERFECQITRCKEF